MEEREAVMDWCSENGSRQYRRGNSRNIRANYSRFARERSGSVTLLLGLALVLGTGLIGWALDYSRANLLTRNSRMPTTWRVSHSRRSRRSRRTQFFRPKRKTGSPPLTPATASPPSPTTWATHFRLAWTKASSCPMNDMAAVIHEDWRRKQPAQARDVEVGVRG
jgi:hypothetical protein